MKDFFSFLCAGLVSGMITLAVLFTFGCATTYPPPQTPVCAKPEAADSVICATATRLQMTPEQIDSMFLDAALVGIGTKVISAKELRSALVDVSDWIVTREILNIQGIINYLTQKAEIDKALAALLSRRLGLINLPILGVAPLTPYDISLIIEGINHQLEQIKYF